MREGGNLSCLSQMENHMIIASEKEAVLEVALNSEIHGSSGF